MASKKASAPSPVKWLIASAKAGEVRGPVATITLSQSSGGRPAISLRSRAIRGWLRSAASTACEKPSRSAASAPPSGAWCASAPGRTIEPRARISRCRIPTALVEASSDRKEFEQTSSARWGVRCAAVARIGRISCRTTGTPEFAACHEASEPASPPPMMWIGRMGALVTKRPANVNAFCRDYQRRTAASKAAVGRRAALSGASRLVRTLRSGRSLARDGPAHDGFNIAAANPDIVQLAVRKLGQLAHRLAIPAPSGKLLRNRLERGHFLLHFRQALAYRSAT